MLQILFVHILLCSRGLPELTRKSLHDIKGGIWQHYIQQKTILTKEFQTLTEDYLKMVEIFPNTQVIARGPRLSG